ncbi:MAG: hypothetical protein ABH824_05775 [Nanoarchaeota archaeon]|nr:hypothetical protein [Nanoarchaeota archaeon]MBU1631864.1 hypothetical protein [Nanoarchaeota archaeon]MBU1876069.1 hypothetical protein [Nanoarchaeota archaeon]
MVNVENTICGYEQEIVAWIRKYYKKLGYDKIIEENKKKVPDFVMQRDGKNVRVEIEMYSSSFLKHKHNPEEVDEVLCIVNDAKLFVKTIEIKELKFWYQLDSDDRVDFFLKCPDTLLVNHRTGEQIHHFQDDWLKLSEEEVNETKENLKKDEWWWKNFKKLGS